MNFDDYFYLPRASRYANALRDADRLPIPYGNMQDNVDATWIMPCIDTTANVYLYSVYPAVTVANGNTVTVFKDGVKQTSGWTFNASNGTYAVDGINPATVTFTSSQGNAVISTSGQGLAWPSTATPTNIIDIIEHFLTVVNDFSSGDFDATSKAQADLDFQDQSYVSAGVINEDIATWELLSKMCGSFLGSIFFNSASKLVITLNIGTTPTNSLEYISYYDQGNVKAEFKLDNLINRLPSNFAYDYTKSEFKKETDQDNDTDQISIGVFGEQKPSQPYQFYWCRDLASVDKVQGIVINQSAFPKWIVELTDNSYKQLHIDVGDYISTTIDFLYDDEGSKYYNQIFQVLSVRQDLIKGRIKFRLLDTGNYLLDGSNRNTNIY